MEFTIRLAGVNIEVKSLYDEVYSLCKDYVVADTERPDYGATAKQHLTVAISPEDIVYEREKNRLESEIEVIPVVNYSDAYLETLAVYRKIATKILDYDTFLMHGAVISVENKGWLFTAPSGTGKTTHLRLWLENIQGSYIVNGDKPLIHIGEEVTVFGTPWAGKEGMQKNTGVTLKGIVMLERSADNRIEQISFLEALPVLIQQAYRPNDKAELEKTLGLIKKLSSRVAFWRLHCNILPEAATTAYQALNEDGWVQ